MKSQRSLSGSEEPFSQPANRNPEVDMADFDAPDEDERQTLNRRLFTYTPPAIKAAVTVDRIMVNYPAFADAMEGLDRVFQLGRELSVQQGITIMGASGSGKTALVRYFLSSQPKSNLFEEGYGAIAIRLTGRPTVGYVVGGLLRRLRYPFPRVVAQTLDIKRQVLIDALRQKRTRLILIDEAQYLLTQARLHGRAQATHCNVTDVVRELMDEVPIAVALMGTSELLELEGADAHLANRMSARFELRGLDVPAVWHGFVRSFAKQSTAIDLSHLAGKEDVARLYQATAGNLRSFKRLVTEATLVAVDESERVVTRSHLRTAFDRVSGKAASKENPYAT